MIRTSKGQNIAYVNGSYLPRIMAGVSIEDRGYQFADGVYEVMNMVNGVLLDGDAHMDRLQDSLDILDIAPPMPLHIMTHIVHELARQNRTQNTMIYLQVSRGVAPRNHFFPDSETRASLVITMSPLKTPAKAVYEKGVSLITHPENRWSRCDAKTICLLPNVLAKQAAKEKGALDVVYIDAEDMVTEGGATSVFLVKNDVLYTHPLTESILPGITRNNLVAIAKENKLVVKEQQFSKKDLSDADELFISSTTMGLMPVTSLDGAKINGGKIGNICKLLTEKYNAFVFEQTGVNFIPT